jgi:hypothetical protein
VDLGYLRDLLGVLEQHSVLSFKEDNIEIQLVARQPLNKEETEIFKALKEDKPIEDLYEHPDAYGRSGFVPSFDEDKPMKGA